MKSEERNLSTDGAGDVLTFKRYVRRRPRYRYKLTEADRAARRENLYKTTIARKGLADCPEVRLLYKLCPEAFSEWTFLNDGTNPFEAKMVPNPITSTQLKLIVAVLKAQRIVANEAQSSKLTGLNASQLKSQTVVPVEAAPTEPPVSQKETRSTRGRKSELTTIWINNSEKVEKMLADGCVEEVRAFIRKEARSFGMSSVGLAKRVREFVAYRRLRLDRQKARIN